MIRNQIHINIKSGLKTPYKLAWLKFVMAKVLEILDVVQPYEIELAIVGNRAIQKLNKMYRGLNVPTDVLSFSLSNKDDQINDIGFILPKDTINHLGSIVISFPFATEQAQANNNAIEQETILLIVHGMLHLLGYDHETVSDARKMRLMERKIIKLLNQRVKLI